MENMENIKKSAGWGLHPRPKRCTIKAILIDSLITSQEIIHQNPPLFLYGNKSIKKFKKILQKLLTFLKEDDKI